MPTSKKINTIKKLGIIAGRGTLPPYLISVCEKQNIKPYIVGIKNQTPVNIMRDHPHIWANLGCAGKIIDFFKENTVSDLVLIGGINRPSWSEIKPDLKALKIISRAGFKTLGDSGLLDSIKDALEKEGFELHGIHEFCDRLLIEEGEIGKFKPSTRDKETIDLGVHISQSIGMLDIGQSVIVQDGIILGVEAIEGTDALIKRCAPLIKPGPKAILVKTCKPQQDDKLDLPTIGLNTVMNAHDAGLAGIVLQAKKVLVVEPEAIAEYANQYKMFVVGISIPQSI